MTLWLIFHMKSRGSAKEWKSTNYLELAKQLPEDQFQIILTGVPEEGDMIRAEVPEIIELPHVQDVTGKLSLDELIDLIGTVDGLLACSTGPLHIAGLAGIRCLGLFPQKRPMHAGRWKPLGTKSEYLEEQIPSEDTFLTITTEDVLAEIKDWKKD